MTVGYARVAERQFPARIVVRVPEGGMGHRYTAMTDWLDENCGIDGWAIAPAGTRGVLNDAVAVYVSTPTCAVGLVARWLRRANPPGCYELRQDELARRVPMRRHRTP